MVNLRVTDAKASKSKNSTKEQNSASKCLSTPNNHDVRKTSKDTLDMTRGDLQMLKKKLRKAKTSQKPTLRTQTEPQNARTEQQIILMTS